MSNQTLPVHLEQSVALSDAIGCLCLVQRLAYGQPGNDRWRIEQIAVTVTECLASLRLRQGEMMSCATPSS